MKLVISGTNLKKYHSGFCADLPAEQAAFLADSQIPVSASVFGYTFANPAWKIKTKLVYRLQQKIKPFHQMGNVLWQKGPAPKQ